MRESGVYCEIHPFATPVDKIRKFAPKGMILSGGPASVHAGESPKISAEIFALGVPVLGICYGEQLICDVLGGSVVPGDTREFGRAEIEVVKDNLLFSGVWRAGGHRQTLL